MAGVLAEARRRCCPPRRCTASCPGRCRSWSPAHGRCRHHNAPSAAITDPSAVLLRQSSSPRPTPSNSHGQYASPQPPQLGHLHRPCTSPEPPGQQKPATTCPPKLPGTRAAAVRIADRSREFPGRQARIAAEAVQLVRPLGRPCPRGCRLRHLLLAVLQEVLHALVLLEVPSPRISHPPKKEHNNKDGISLARPGTACPQDGSKTRNPRQAPGDPKHSFATRSPPSPLAARHDEPRGAATQRAHNRHAKPSGPRRLMTLFRLKPSSPSAAAGSPPLPPPTPPPRWT